MDYNITYVNSPYTIKDVIKYFSLIKRKRKLRKIMPFASGVELINVGNGQNITLINTHVVFSINFLPNGKLYSLLHAINHKMIAFRVKRSLRKRNINDYIFINSFNYLYDSLDKFLKPSLNVYHCIDALIKNVSIKHGRRQEELAIARADVVIVTSEALLHDKKEINPNCYLVKNAVEIDHISKVFDDIDIHESVTNLKTPVLGFIGNIERRMDFKLINTIAGNNPEWTFALIGPVEKKYFPDDIQFHENVHFAESNPMSFYPIY